jgi:hypothetical protein
VSVIEIGLDDESAAVAELVEKLRAAFPQADPQSVAALVHSVYARYDGARIRDFIPLLVERSARETLAESAGVITWSS